MSDELLRILAIVFFTIIEIFGMPFLWMGFILLFTTGPILWGPTIIFFLITFLVYHSLGRFAGIVKNNIKIFESKE